MRTNRENNETLVRFPNTPDLFFNVSAFLDATHQSRIPITKFAERIDEASEVVLTQCDFPESFDKSNRYDFTNILFVLRRSFMALIDTKDKDVFYVYTDDQIPLNITKFLNKLNMRAPEEMFEDIDFVMHIIIKYFEPEFDDYFIDYAHLLRILKTSMDMLNSGVIISRKKG